jgi:citrate synthase
MTFHSGLEGVVAAETVLSEVDGEAGRLILRGHSPTHGASNG